MGGEPIPDHLPVSPACERNRDPILGVLREVFVAPGEVLEIGSGTGQHAVYFARHLPWRDWHATDRPEYHDGIRAWMEYAGPTNLHGPWELDVTQREWPLARVADSFAANTVHIMHWPQVEALFAGVSRILVPGGRFALYGPFHVGGQHRSPSNERFDAQLRAQDPGMGIRDRNELEALAGHQGLVLEAVHPLPANNDLLIWRRDPEAGR